MPQIRQTHTIALLEIPKTFHDWLTQKVTDLGSGYSHMFMDDGAIDMHGIGVISDNIPDAQTEAQIETQTEHPSPRPPRPKMRLQMQFIPAKADANIPKNIPRDILKTHSYVVVHVQEETAEGYSTVASFPFDELKPKAIKTHFSKGVVSETLQLDMFEGISS